MTRRTDKRGRSKGSLSSFVQVERYIMQSPAWRSLTPNARASYLEVFYGYDGSNNGRILLSAQMLADRINRDKSTAARALKELEQLGLIECQSKGGFNCKLPHASEWRLTALKCDVTNALPSKLFMQWKPQDLKRGGTGEVNGGTGATDGLKTTRNYPSQWHGCNREGQFEGVSGGTGATPLYSNHTTHTTPNAQLDAARQGASVIASPLDAKPDTSQFNAHAIREASPPNPSTPLRVDQRQLDDPEHIAAVAYAPGSMFSKIMVEAKKRNTLSTASANQQAA